MDYAGSGITGTKTVKLREDYTVDSKLAIKWFQLGDQNWIGTDRGSTEDIFEATVTTAGKESDISEIINDIEANRTASSGTPNVLTLSNFSDTEHIFGEDIDHSINITATVVDIDPRKPSSFKGWGLGFRLRAINPSATGSAVFPTLDNFEYEYLADNELTIKKQDTYTSQFTYTDRDTDLGEFKGVFTFTQAETRDFRNYIRNTRTSPVALSSIPGVANFLGDRRGNGSSGFVYIKDYKDLGLFGVNKRKTEVLFVEAL